KREQKGQDTKTIVRLFNSLVNSGNLWYNFLFCFSERKNGSFLEKGLAGGIDVAGTYGKDQITGLGQLLQLGSYILQGGAVNAAGNLVGQILRRDAQIVGFTGGIDLGQ